MARRSCPRILSLSTHPLIPVLRLHPPRNPLVQPHPTRVAARRTGQRPALILKTPSTPMMRSIGTRSTRANALTAIGPIALPSPSGIRRKSVCSFGYVNLESQRRLETDWGLTVPPRRLQVLEVHRLLRPAHVRTARASLFDLNSSRVYPNRSGRSLPG